MIIIIALSVILLVVSISYIQTLSATSEIINNQREELKIRLAKEKIYQDKIVIMEEINTLNNNMIEWHNIIREGLFERLKEVVCNDGKTRSMEYIKEVLK